MKKLYFLSVILMPLLLASCGGTITPDDPSGKEKTDEELGVTAVDLGLSVFWCDKNIDAVSPDDSGSYFAWGETVGKTSFTKENYKWGNDSAGGIKKYNSADGPEFLEAADDAAHAKLGGKWRMPTTDEWLELRDKCSWKWTKQGNSNGFLVTSKDGSTTIFLPAAGGYTGSSLLDVGNHGFYWTSRLLKSSPASAWSFWIYKSTVTGEDFPRYYGFPVRAVKDK